MYFRCFSAAAITCSKQKKSTFGICILHYQYYNYIRSVLGMYLQYPGTCQPDPARSWPALVSGRPASPDGLAVLPTVSPQFLSAKEAPCPSSLYNRREEGLELEHPRLQVRIASTLPVRKNL